MLLRSWGRPGPGRKTPLRAAKFRADRRGPPSARLADALQVADVLEQPKISPTCLKSHWLARQPRLQVVRPSGRPFTGGPRGFPEGVHSRRLAA